MRCGVVENDLAYQTALINLVDCMPCLEAVLRHNDSQITLNRYVELERMAGEVTINPS
jgi:hypothetical protein